MTGGDDKKRKRRLSERDDEPPKKSPKDTPEKKSEEKSEADVDDDEEEPKPTFSFYRDTLEEAKEEEEEEEMEAAKKEDEAEEVKAEADGSPACDENVDDNGRNSGTPSVSDDQEPREVKGILVYHRGKEKRNKRIKFKPDSEIVSIKYFELDEDERVNVNKVKFENMRKFELNMEKAALKSNNLQDEETDNDRWYKPNSITVEGRQPFTYGHNSKEKDIQFNREKTVLAAFLYTKETIPDTPSEPDAAVLSSPNRAVQIPLDDLSDEGGTEQDYSSGGWPEPQTNQVDRQFTLESELSLTPALSNILSTAGVSNIMSTFMPPPAQAKLSTEELNILKAQTEAMAQLGIMPGVDIPPTFPPPRGMPPDMPPHHGPHPPHFGPPMDNPGFEFGRPPNDFYGGGPGGPGGPGPGGPPHRGGGFGGPHFDRGRGRFNNFNQNNFHPRGGGGPPGPPGPGFPPRGFRGGGQHPHPPMRGGNEFFRYCHDQSRISIFG